MGFKAYSNRIISAQTFFQVRVMFINFKTRVSLSLESAIQLPIEQ